MADTTTDTTATTKDALMQLRTYKIHQGTLIPTTTLSQAVKKNRAPLPPAPQPTPLPQPPAPHTTPSRPGTGRLDQNTDPIHETRQDGHQGKEACP